MTCHFSLSCSLFCIYKSWLSACRIGTEPIKLYIRFHALQYGQVPTLVYTVSGSIT